MANIEFPIYDNDMEHVTGFQYVKLSPTWNRFLDYVRSYSDEKIWNHSDNYHALNYCETQVSNELRQYDAYFDDSKHTIIFNDASKYTWFMVKYG